MRRAPKRYTRSPRRPTAALTAAICQHGVFGLKLAAGALAAATAALAIVNNHDGNQAATAAFEPARNETVIYRQAAVRPVVHHHHDHADDADAAEDHEEQQPAAAPTYYTRVVQTIRFLNPNSRLAAAREAAPQGLIKVGGFIAFPAKNAPDSDDAVKPRKRAASIMNEVDDYLWEVYQRVPTKKDGAGDFTWKDPAAAKRVGMSLQEYVIGGMDPEFREQLYHAGKAMDAAGVQWSLLSAFRDDYRQGIATGFKARGGNSLHGGSRRTGGYGHGRAVDVTGVEFDERGVELARRPWREIRALPSDARQRSGPCPAARRLAQDRAGAARGPHPRCRRGRQPRQGKRQAQSRQRIEVIGANLAACVPGQSRYCRTPIGVMSAIHDLIM